MEFAQIVKGANKINNDLFSKNNLKLTNCLDKDNAYLFYNSLFRTKKFEPELIEFIESILEYPNKRGQAIEIPLMLIDIMRDDSWLFGGYTKEQRQAISAAAITNKNDISKKVCEEWSKNRIPYKNLPLINPMDAFDAFIMDETQKTDNEEKIKNLESFYKFVQSFSLSDVCPVGLIITLDFMTKGKRQNDCQRIYETIHTNAQPDTKYKISKIIQKYYEAANPQTPTGKVPDNIDDILSII